MCPCESCSSKLTSSWRIWKLLTSKHIDDSVPESRHCSGVLQGLVKNRGIQLKRIQFKHSQLRGIHCEGYAYHSEGR